MNAEKTGLFIAELRGEHSLTQRELADKIGVTDKAVSKWERGHGFPDVAILETLSKELEVSVTELMSGERSTPETVKAQSDSTLVETLKYIKQMSRKTIGTLIIILGACILCSPLFTAERFRNMAVVMGVGVIVAAKGILMLAPKRFFKPFVLPKVALEGISLGALAAAIVLEIRSDGFVLWWASFADAPQGAMFSYFNPISFGMGHFLPFITAVMTAAVTIFTVIVMLLDKRFTKPRNALFVCIIVTAVISACSFLYNVGSVTMVGVLITLALVISAIFRAAANSTRQ